MRTVGAGGEVDLDPRAVTDENDIIDLDELYLADHQHAPKAPLEGQTAAEDEPPTADQMPAPRRPRTSVETDAEGSEYGAALAHGSGLAGESNHDFDRWLARRDEHRDASASTGSVVSSASAPAPGTARLPSQVRSIPAERATSRRPRVSSSNERSIATAQRATRRPNLPGISIGRRARFGAFAALALTVVAAATVAISTLLVGSSTHAPHAQAAIDASVSTPEHATALTHPRKTAAATPMRHMSRSASRTRPHARTHRSSAALSHVFVSATRSTRPTYNTTPSPPSTPVQQAPVQQAPVQQAPVVQTQSPSAPAGPTSLGGQVGNNCAPKCS